jgi:membrane associated rhomboid family serine protease
LLALNVVVCGLQLGLGWQMGIDSAGVAVPLGGVSLRVLGQGQVWMLLTSLFVHSGLPHLVVNVFFIAYFGRVVLSLLGTGGLVKIYFAAGVVGAVLQMIVNALVQDDVATPVLGASACACGLMVAACTMLPREHLSEWLYSILPFRVTQQRLVAALFVGTLFLGVGTLVSEYARELWGGGAYFAHLGGMAVGWYAVKLLGYGEQPMTYHQLIRKKRRVQPEMVRKRAVARLPHKVRLAAVRPEMDDEAILVQQRSRMKPSTPAVEDVNDILDKISSDGMGSLTEEERRRLEIASRELAVRKRGA